MDPGRLKVWLQCYMGRGNIQFVEAQLEPAILNELKRKIAEKCKLILLKIGYSNTETPMVDIDISKEFEFRPDIEMGVRYA